MEPGLVEKVQLSMLGMVREVLKAPKLSLHDNLVAFGADSRAGMMILGN